MLRRVCIIFTGVRFRPPTLAGKIAGRAEVPAEPADVESSPGHGLGFTRTGNRRAIGEPGNAMSDQPGHCLNCQSSLKGEYCHRCGQRAGRRELSFAGLMGEIADELFNWDSRLWRTLVPLLFRPGFLSAEFMAGRRSRYVPPLRLYLIISFLLFLVISQAGKGLFQVSVATAPDSQDTASGGPSPASAPATTVNGGTTADRKADPVVVITDENSPDWLRRLEARLQDNARRLRDDPQSIVAEALEYLPQMMFLLLPLFALLLRVAYLLSPFHYLQHLVFALHYHSFAYLLYLFGIALERAAVHADGFLVVLLLLYLPLALKRAYGSALAAAIGKSLAVQFAYAMLLGGGIAGVFLLTLSMM